MIKDIEVLNEIITIRKKTELLANPLYNDFCGSHFWGDIDERLEKIEKDIENNLKLFGIIKNE
jgi:hypothetical protein